MTTEIGFDAERGMVDTDGNPLGQSCLFRDPLTGSKAHDYAHVVLEDTWLVLYCRKCGHKIHPVSPEPEG